jgi:hypothetical protein
LDILKDNKVKTGLLRKAGNGDFSAGNGDFDMSKAGVSCLKAGG